MLKKDIEQFLANEQIGFVGVSRDGTKFSNKVYQKMHKCGHKLHPVHPEMGSMDGVKCAQRVQDLGDDVQALMVVASPGVCAEVLGELAGNRIKHIWVFSGPGNQPDVEVEVQRLTSEGVGVVSGLCPFMFLEPVGAFHAIHRFFVRLAGKYPK